MDSHFMSKSILNFLKFFYTFFIIIGWMMTGLFGLLLLCFLLPSPSNKASIFFLFLISFLIGLFLLCLGREGKKHTKLFKQYSALLALDPSHSISYLAISTRKSVEEVKKDVNILIKGRFLINAYIDTDLDCIVFSAQPDNNLSTEYITITCKGCGAAKKIKKRSVGVCEYCGSKVGETEHVK